MNDTSKPASEPIDRPDAILDDVAGNTFQAFNAMETTKRRHYQLLEVLDNKKKNYNLDPNEREQVLLANLLKDHDEQVRRFTALSAELKQTNADAHKALFVYIGALAENEPKSRITH